MTRKSTLSAWASRLGADLPASATVRELEQAIEAALATPATTGISLAQGIRNNWTVLRTEVPAIARAVAQNLLN